MQETKLNKCRVTWHVCLPTLVNYFKDTANKPFEFAWLMHQSWSKTNLNSVINGATIAIKNNPVSLLFPCGLAVQFITDFIPREELTNSQGGDNLHMKEGLPCIMGAYVAMSVITEYLSVSNRVVGNPLRMTIAKQKTLKIPGANGTVNESMTDEDYYHCQIAAIKAFNAGKGLMSKIQEEMFNDLMK